MKKWDDTCAKKIKLGPSQLQFVGSSVPRGRVLVVKNVTMVPALSPESGFASGLSTEVIHFSRTGGNLWLFWAVKHLADGDEADL